MTTVGCQVIKSVFENNQCCENQNGLVNTECKAFDDLQNDVFPFGVKSGSPAEGSMMLWTKLNANLFDVEDCHWLVVEWSDTMDGDSLPSTSAKEHVRACKNDLFVTKPRITGLSPFTTYYYQFTLYAPSVNAPVSTRPQLNSEFKAFHSPIGQFKSLPAPNQHIENVTYASLGCSTTVDSLQNSFYQLSKLAPDLVVHTGDYVYADGARYGPVNYNSPLGLVSAYQTHFEHLLPDTFEQFSQVYDAFARDPDVRELHRKAAFAYNIGDHEVYNNWEERKYSTNYGNYLSYGGKKTFEEIVHAGVKAWVLNNPIDADFTVENGRYDKDVHIQYGDLLSVFVTDEYSKADPAFSQTLDGTRVSTNFNFPATPWLPSVSKDNNGVINQTKADADLLVRMEVERNGNRIQADQMARFEQAMKTNTTWKIISTAKPDTLVEFSQIADEIGPDFTVGKEWPMTDVRAFGGYSASTGYESVNYYLERARALYQSGHIDTPYLQFPIDTYIRKNRWNMHDIICANARNVLHFYGDWHSIGLFDGYHHSDMKKIASAKPTFSDGKFTDAQGNTITPMMFSAKAGTTSYNFNQANGGTWNSPEHVASLSATNDAMKRHMLGTIELPQNVHSQKSATFVTLTHERADIKYINGVEYASTHDPTQYSFQENMNLGRKLEGISHPFMRRLDESHVVGHYTIEATDQVCKTSPAVVHKSLSQGRENDMILTSELPDTYPRAL